MHSILSRSLVLFWFFMKPVAGDAAINDSVFQNVPEVGLIEKKGPDELAFEAWKIVRGAGGVDQDAPRGMAMLEQAAMQGSLVALHNLAHVYDLGLYRVAPDKGKAILYYRKAAKDGFAGSQNNYGWHLYQGNGVDKNVTEAVYWITRAVEQGEPFAYGSLATIMLDANVFTPDKIEIYKWLKLAVTFMPKGEARNKALSQLNDLKFTMNLEEILEGEKRADTWQPLKETNAPMSEPQNP